MKKICNIHGEYEVEYREFFGTRIELACPSCVQEKENKERIEEEKEASRRKQLTFERSMTSRGIPKRYWGKSIKDFDSKKYISKEDMTILVNYAHTQEDVSRLGKSLFFYGAPGTGKTHVAISILKVWKNGGFYTTARKYTRELRSTYSGDGQEQDIIDKYVEYDLLILDEIGKQFNTEAERCAMFDLTNERYNVSKPTIFISNFSIEDFTEFIGKEVADRICENGEEPILFKGSSFRKGTKGGKK